MDLAYQNLGLSLGAYLERKAKIFRRLESPIEKVFFAALWSLGRLEHLDIGEVRSFDPSNTAETASSFGSNDAHSSERIGLVAQANVLGHRVDFLIRSRPTDPISDAWRWAIVECDGHDYHERTAEQAERDRSRDREFQQSGYRVFRFTGREIVRDPVKCAMEVLSWADEYFCAAA